MRAALDPAGFRRELARRGMTQGEFALATGVTEATVSHALAGRQVSYLTIRKFARTLTVTPALLGTENIIGTQREALAAAAASPGPAAMAEVSCDPTSAI